MHLLRMLFVALFLWMESAMAAPEWSLPPAAHELGDPPPPPPHFVTVPGSFLRVHGGPEDRDTLLMLSRHGSSSVMRLADTLHVPVGGTIHVFVAHDDDEFRSLQPGDAPLWADGTAYPHLGAIYLRSPSARGGDAEPLTEVLDHELVHILLGRAFHPAPTPQWLQEGLAQVMSGEFGPDTTERLAEGMLGTGLLELDALARGFPADPLRARMAYAQSADLIAFLRVTYGDASLVRLIDELARGETVETAFRRATGDSLDDVDLAWRARLTQGPSLTWSALLKEEVLFALCGIALVFGGIWRRRRFRRRLAEMEEEERRADELMRSLLATRSDSG